jgi:hypothetical protein
LPQKNAEKQRLLHEFHEFAELKTGRPRRRGREIFAVPKTKIKSSPSGAASSADNAQPPVNNVGDDVRSL